MWLRSMRPARVDPGHRGRRNDALHPVLATRRRIGAADVCSRPLPMTSEAESWATACLREDSGGEGEASEQPDQVPRARLLSAHLWCGGAQGCAVQTPVVLGGVVAHQAQFRHVGPLAVSSRLWPGQGSNPLDVKITLRRDEIERKAGRGVSPWCTPPQSPAILRHRSRRSRHPSPDRPQAAEVGVEVAVPSGWAAAACY